MRRNSQYDKFLILGTDKLLIMRTLNIAMSDLEYEKFGIKTDHLSFTDIVNMMNREYGSYKHSGEPTFAHLNVFIIH